MVRALVALLLLTLVSCNQDNLDQRGIDNSIVDITRYDETKHFSEKEKTIVLHGDSLQVVDQDSVYIFQGDIRISKKSIDELRGAVRTDRMWNNNTVHYQLSNFPTASKTEQLVIYKAIEEIENKTYLNFIPKVSNDGIKSYLDISYTGENLGYAYSDYIGKRPKGINKIVIPRSMLLGSTGLGVAVHEICHALGMYHEQSRADRDKYINVDFSNTEDPAQFKTYKERDLNGKDIGPFDFNSIMLYGSFAGAKDVSRPVMTKKDGSYFFSQRNGLSQQDVQSLIHLYPAGNIVKFENGLGDFEKYQDLGLTQIRQRVLKCPEPTSIQFSIKYKFTPSYEHYSKGVAGGALRSLGYMIPVIPDYPEPEYSHEKLSSEDCKISIILEAENQLYDKKKYTHEINLSNVVLPWATERWHLALPKGYYKVRIRLVGKIISSENIEYKEKLLKKVLYSAGAFLSMETASINGVVKTIPNDFQNKYRRDTFVQL